MDLESAPVFGDDGCLTEESDNVLAINTARTVNILIRAVNGINHNLTCLSVSGPLSP